MCILVNGYDFFSFDGRFLCEPCCADEGFFEADVVHILNKPVNESEMSLLQNSINYDISPSHKEFLSIWNGCSLFNQDKPVEEDVGIKIYSTYEIPPNTKRVREENANALKELLDDGEPNVIEGVNDDLKNWIPNLVIIGEELMSGNYFALDHRNKDGNGEYPVMYLEHELLYMGSDDRPILAQTFEELILMIIQNPAEFLNDRLSCITRYEDGITDEQWIPNKYMKNRTSRAQLCVGRSIKKSI